MYRVNALYYVIHFDQGKDVISVQLSQKQADIKQWTFLIKHSIIL